MPVLLVELGYCEVCEVLLTRRIVEGVEVIAFDAIAGRSFDGEKCRTDEDLEGTIWREAGGGLGGEGGRRRQCKDGEKIE